MKTNLKIKTIINKFHQDRQGNPARWEHPACDDFVLFTKGGNTNGTK